MSTALAFWILALLWFALGIIGAFKDDRRLGLAGNVIAFLLICLLGWATFGPALR